MLATNGTNINGAYHGNRYVDLGDSVEFSDATLEKAFIQEDGSRLLTETNERLFSKRQ
jgi:hypothetical protein